ncbi:ABC transporter substrate-binding protein [Methylobacterium sp. sgz302541]|uniref:ABC transporter substrate-binding protein n=1 Tax=unclassified Methylobacterium TaxID=2615210 RepID=UPI003D338B9D
MSEKLTRRSFTAAALGSAFLPAMPALAQTREKVVVSWLPIMQTTAFYVALEEKLFEKAGIEVEAVRFEAPNQIIDSLVSGRADVGAPGAAAGITALAEEKFPGTFKVFGLQGGSAALGRINDGLIVAKDSTIAGFADLRGKTLGHLPGIQWRTISRHVVRKAGLDPDKDVRLVELAVGLQVPAVISGSADATLSLEPVGSIATALGEARRAVTNPCASAVADPFYSGVSVLTTKFLKERPETARKVVTVLDAATRLTETDFPRLRAVLPKYTAIKAPQVEIVAQPYLRPFADLNAKDLASYQALVDVFAAEGVLKKPMKVADIMLAKAEIGL